MVRQPSPFSDHSQLVGWIRIPNRPTSSLTSQQELFSLPRQFIWSQESRDKFITALQSPESQQTISDFENLDLESFNDVNIAVAKFVNILESAAKNSLRLGNIKKKRTRKSQPWYDAECHILKKKLTYISNQKHKDPFDEQTRRCWSVYLGVVMLGVF